MIKMIPEATHYGISEDGKVFCVIDGDVLHEIIPRENGRGYFRVRLPMKTGGFREMLVHRLVAEAFIPNEDSFPQVNHKDLDKSNNRSENLEWCTGSHNMLHFWNRKRIDKTADATIQ